ncbi:MAG: helix-turn-helix transcriptional regulator, partial [Clostridiaceae bacterium]|nr:helix-turn-helix transcriptional regulator [Clostridiaceae bacterium]
FTSRQKQIVELVKKYQPITSEHLAAKLNMTRAALRPDLTILTMSDMLEARPKVGYFYSGKSLNNLGSDFIKSIKVAEIMSSPVVIDEAATVYDAIVMLFLRDVGTIYIQSKGALTGVVSRKDFIKIAIGNNDIQNMPVGMIMSRMPNIIYIFDTESAYDAVAKLITHEIDSIPVVEPFKNDEGKELFKITGKVSKTNMTKLLYDLCKQ